MHGGNAVLDHLAATLGREREAEVEDLHRHTFSWEAVKCLDRMLR